MDETKKKPFNEGFGDALTLLKAKSQKPITDAPLTAQEKAPIGKSGARQFPSGSASQALMKTLDGKRGKNVTEGEKSLYVVEDVDSKTLAIFDECVQKYLGEASVFNFFIHVLSVFKESGGAGEEKNLIIFRLSDYAKKLKIGKPTAYKTIQKGLVALGGMRSVKYQENSIKSEHKNFKVSLFFEELQYQDGIVIIKLAKETASVLSQYSTLLLDERILQLNSNSYPYASRMHYFIESHRKNTPEERKNKNGVVFRDRITVAYLLEKCGFPSPDSPSFDSKYKVRIIKPFIKHMDTMYKDWHFEDALYKEIVRRHKGEENRDSYELLNFDDFKTYNVYTVSPITDLLPSLEKK